MTTLFYKIPPHLPLPKRLCRNPILMVAAGFSLRATHWFYWNRPQPKGCDYQLRHSLKRRGIIPL